MALIEVNGRWAVLVDGAVCLWLERHGRLSTLRTLARGLHPRVAAQLAEIRRAAELSVSAIGQPEPPVQAGHVSASGQSLADPVAAVPLSSWLMSAQGAATKLGIGPRKVQRLVVRGHLEGDKIGRDWIVTRESVERFAAERGAAA